ncbi:glycosyltransferase family 4 protein [Clostridiales bacterium]|nr:glycosyltransferase family 4 protein [Clostridiales bacterium]
MRVGFYLNNSNYENIDFSSPEKGNPGVRGTQYMIWAVACNLARTYNDLNIVLFADIIDSMPADIYCISASGEEDALKKGKAIGVDIIVLRVSISTPERVFKTIVDLDIQCITWSHNFEDYYLAEMISKTPQIIRNVCVGRQQLERLCDHKVFEKSLYIYNALQFDEYSSSYDVSARAHNVTYVGMLDSSKGFHRLARIWKWIAKIDKKAELHVIGSGSLGSKNTLGPLGLADLKYEKRIAKYICDEKGEILPSIHFYGNKGGKEKNDLMSKSKVGIANPTGIGETFCIVAVEFEALGVPVVSAKYGGLLDTVENKRTGLLANTDMGLVRAIIKLLNDDEYNRELGNYAAIYSRKKFGFEVALKEWHDLLLDAEHYKTDEYKKFNYLLNQFKICRIINKGIKGVHAFSGFPSLLKCDYLIRKGARKVIAVLKR